MVVQKYLLEEQCVARCVVAVVVVVVVVGLVGVVGVNCQKYLASPHFSTGCVFPCAP
jgi:hypothetical protein